MVKEEGSGKWYWNELEKEEDEWKRGMIKDKREGERKDGKREEDFEEEKYLNQWMRKRMKSTEEFEMREREEVWLKRGGF